MRNTSISLYQIALFFLNCSFILKDVKVPKNTEFAIYSTRTAIYCSELGILDA